MCAMHGETIAADSERLSRHNRLRKRRDFLRVQNTGRRIRTRHFVLLVCGADHSRLGITVTKRIAAAVGRNRVKRVVREVYRRNRELFPPRSEVVVIARRGAAALHYHEVRAELAAAGDRLLQTPEPSTADGQR